MNRREWMMALAAFSAVPPWKEAGAGGIGGATYYVDNGGDDGHDGLSPATAWRTCSKVNSATLGPGDSVIFTSGQTFAGPLTLTNSGVRDGYIYVGTGRNAQQSVPDFASGGSWSAPSNPAIITAQDTYPGGVNLNDCEYIWLDNISVVGSGVNIAARGPSTGYTASASSGLSLKCTRSTMSLRGVRITAVTVSGCKWGITAWLTTNGMKGWDGLQFHRCSAHDCQWWGWQLPVIYDMDTQSGFANDPMSPSTNLYVGYSDTYNIPGTASRQAIGFAFFASDSAIVEHCVAHDIQAARGSTGVAGTAGFQYLGITNYVTQYCEAYRAFTNRSHYDGHGFECEPALGTNRWQYCYAHDNDGAGFQVPSGVIRYCISANNLKDASAKTAAGDVHSEILHATIDNTPLTVYGCTAIATTAGKHAYGNVRTAKSDNQGADYLYNNILVARAGAHVIETWSIGGLIGNVYYANGGAVAIRNNATSTLHTSLASLRAAGFETHRNLDYGHFGDPLLANPGGAPSAGTLPANSVATLSYWNLTAGSPAIDEGIDYSLLSIAPGSKDFRGRANYSGRAYDAGAVEAQAERQALAKTPTTLPGSIHTPKPSD